ncbi:Siderophore iron transporter mirC [Ceratocystis fimbriata CBS 114723]|uniref:Siderophore iron transporter mirC n=2 Tax=Ceratocystis TaxID=5157 RepID=A0A2C5X0C3_9PEZI|nr:Siderophore iron transporter mirC [Ceratocystis fimbriata CBS 114723]
MPPQQAGFDIGSSSTATPSNLSLPSPSISDIPANAIPALETTATASDNSRKNEVVHSINNVPTQPSSPLVVAITSSDSAGVVRMKGINAITTPRDKAMLFLGVLVLSWAYGLDGTMRYTYQNYATASFHQHSLLATVNVLRAVIATVAQPTAGKIANVFGRMELIFLAILFYTVGTAIQAASSTMNTFAMGAVLYQIGYTMTILLVEVLVADSSSTRDRVWVSYIPALPFAVNTWISGFIADHVLRTLGWEWGIGMWAIIFPVCCMPLLYVLTSLERRAKRKGLIPPAPKTSLAEYFHKLDVPGVILIAISFSLLLVPLTLAGGAASQWRQPYILVPLVLSVPAFAALGYWEANLARYPMVPFSALKDRGVWAPLVLALLLNLAWYMQGDYLYTSLVVCFDFSAPMAVIVASLYSFVGTVVGFSNGLLIRRVRRLKFSIVAGTILMAVAFGLMMKFRGSPTSFGKAGIIVCECILGFAGALYPYPTQAVLQARLKHEHQSAMLGVYLAMYQVGSASGNALSGLLWRQTLPKLLHKNMPGNAALAIATFQDPIGTSDKFPVGTPERTAIIKSISKVQYHLCIFGLALSGPIIGIAMILRDHKLNDKQTLAEENDGLVDEKAGNTTG